METYDLKEISRSFFSYLPILKALQDKESSPMLSELARKVHGDSARPDYMPDTVMLPTDFDDYILDLESRRTEHIVESTTLDKSQADALYHALTNKVAMVQGPPGTGEGRTPRLLRRCICSLHRPFPYRQNISRRARCTDNTTKCG
jgi:hypothetical protein